jgi:hypothetical protein
MPSAEGIGRALMCAVPLRPTRTRRDRPPLRTHTRAARACVRAWRAEGSEWATDARDARVVVEELMVERGDDARDRRAVHAGRVLPDRRNQVAATKHTHKRKCKCKCKTAAQRTHSWWQGGAAESARGSTAAATGQPTQQANKQTNTAMHN